MLFRSIHWGRILVDAGFGEPVPGAGPVVDFVDANHVPRRELVNLVDRDEWWVDRCNGNVADGRHDGLDFSQSVSDHGSGEPLGIAGIWSTWHNPSGEIINSFTMLTINADDHPLMENFHRPKDEKRMVVILPPKYFDEWLSTGPEQSARFLIPYPAKLLRISIY